jgi:hypothetical protein
MANLSSLIDWLNDLTTRKEAQTAFSKMTQGAVQENQFVWGDGRYILLHFDLITIRPNGVEAKRDDVYKLIGELVEANKGVRLGGSVYLAPLIPGQSSERCAALFWNVLATRTASQLMHGDAFYIHYAPDQKNLLGGISQIVPAKANSIVKVEVPAA